MMLVSPFHPKAILFVVATCFGLAAAGHVPAAFAQSGKKGCTNRLPPPGSIYKGNSVSIPNHCRCNGGTLIVTGGDNINWESGRGQKGPSRSYRCA